MSDTLKLIPAIVPKLPPKIDYAALISELTAAHAAVGELRGFLDAIPNPNLLIAPFRKREAVASSAIEGTRATLAEVLEYEALDVPKTDPTDKELTRRIEDIHEITNYESAMAVALKELATRPIGEVLLKRTHEVLLNSVRGANKDRGNFRREQVRVGDYIPPEFKKIPELIGNWETYLNTDVEKDPLIRIGVAHYQFEAIHPFLDGNGRIGRLIIPLFLCEVNLLQTPVLFISHFLEEHKVEYQKLLHAVDTDAEWEAWMKFFLHAVEAQAKTTTQMAKEIQALYENLKNKALTTIRSPYTITVLDELFKSPITTSKSVRNILPAKSRATTYNVMSRFVEEGILQEYKSVGKENVYIFSQLMNLLRV